MVRLKQHYENGTYNIIETDRPSFKQNLTGEAVHYGKPKLKDKKHILTIQ